MPRVDLNESKNKIQQTVPPKSHRIRNRLILLVVLVLLIVVPIFWLVRSAVAQVEPSHLVTPTVTVEEELTPQIQRIFFLQRELSPSAQLSLTISEGALTKSLRSILQEQAEGFFDINRVQVAVLEDDALEIYLPVDHDKFAADVRFYVRPALEDGELKLKLDRAYLGRMPVSPSLLDKTVQAGLNTVTATFNEQINKYATIFTVELADGQLILSGSM